MEVPQAQTKLTSSGRAKLAYHLKHAQHPRCANLLSRENNDLVLICRDARRNCPQSVAAMPILPPPSTCFPECLPVGFTFRGGADVMNGQVGACVFLFS